MGKLHVKSAAAIDIGSSGVRMLVSQWNGTSVENLDYLEKPVLLGQEVFSTGYLTFETVQELSAILAGFTAVAQEYGANRIHTTATTALREAVNQAYILDHLQIHNGLQVKIMEDSEAAALIFHHLRRETRMSVGRSLLVYSGTGTVDFAVQKDDTIHFVHSMHTGLLKVAELLREAEEQSLHANRVAEEFLESFLERRDAVMGFGGIDSLLFGVGELSPLLILCGHHRQKSSTVLSRQEIETAYKSCEELSLGQLAQRHRFEEKEMAAAYTTLILLRALCRFTGIEQVHCMRCSLTDANMDLILRPDARRQYNNSLRADTIASVLELAGRYGGNLVHARHVASFALILFDKLRKLHGLAKKHSMYLHAACILHELARFTNAGNPAEATFHMVKNTQIYGVRSRESLLIANIIAPRSLLGVERASSASNALPEQYMLIAAKLHALLHLADALDYSRKQKAILTQVELDEDNCLSLHLQVDEDFTLEKIMFQQSASLFREIFGITPVLHIEDTHNMEETR